MKKRKKKQRMRWISFFFLFLLFLSGGLCLVFHKKEVNSIVFQETLEFEINSELVLSSLIQNSFAFEILEQDKKIDTSRLGKQEVVVHYKDGDQEKQQICTIQIIDQTPPKITYQKELWQK